MKYKNITKGRGDSGETNLLFGETVTKDHEIIRLLGSVDELNASLGICIAQKTPNSGELSEIQDQLFRVMGYIAALPASNEKGLEYKIFTYDNIDSYNIKLDFMLKTLSEALDKTTKGQAGWVKYGSGGVAAAQLDLATTVCRRAEVELVSYLNKSLLDGEILLRYFNRLSKVLYLYARLNSK